MDDRKFVPFAAPEIGEDEIREVVDTLRNGWLTTGPKVQRFEADFTAWLGGGVESIAVNSATAGLHLALEAVGIGPGDEVITTTDTFTATAEVIRYLGADRFSSIYRRIRFAIDPQAVARAVTPRTKAIMPVHYGGRSAGLRRHRGGVAPGGSRPLRGAQATQRAGQAAQTAHGATRAGQADLLGGARGGDRSGGRRASAARAGRRIGATAIRVPPRAWRTICRRCASTCSYLPRLRKRFRSSNLLERSLEEVRRRTKVIGRFPGETSCLSLCWAVLDLVIDAAHGLGLTELDRQHLARLAIEREHASQRVSQIA